MRDSSEFKFRAWHKGKMQQVSLNDLILAEGYYDHWTDAEAAIMAWTGLFDKNGQEIYEGDIVTWEAMGTLYTADVAWIPGLAQFQPNDMAEEVEVIGNIYEQPELLE